MKPDASSCGECPGPGEETAAHRRRFRAPRARGLLATSGALAAGISVAVLAAGVSFAYLNSSAPAGQASTITAGTSGLNLQYGAGAAAPSVTIPATAFQNMLPGDILGVQVNVINVGDVPQTIGAAVSASSAWETRIAAGACPATVIAGAALTTTSTGAIPLALGATQPVCIQVVLPSTAAAASEGTSVIFTVNFTGTQLHEHPHQVEPPRRCRGVGCRVHDPCRCIGHRGRTGPLKALRK